MLLAAHAQGLGSVGPDGLPPYMATPPRQGQHPGNGLKYPMQPMQWGLLGAKGPQQQQGVGPPPPSPFGPTNTWDQQLGAQHAQQQGVEHMAMLHARATAMADISRQQRMLGPDQSDGPWAAPPPVNSNPWASSRQ